MPTHPVRKYKRPIGLPPLPYTRDDILEWGDSLSAMGAPDNYDKVVAEILSLGLQVLRIIDEAPTHDLCTLDAIIGAVNTAAWGSSADLSDPTRQN